MNVFVLTTGRSGSLCFARACRCIDNYTAGHETARRYDLEYPARHIEVDNRLAWFLGRLDAKYPDAFYVHLTRNRDDVARSFARRGASDPGKLLFGFVHSIKQGRAAGLRNEAVELVDTVTANVRLFLRDRPHEVVPIEEPAGPFSRFWRAVGAEGDLAAALDALGHVRHRGPA